MSKKLEVSTADQQIYCADFEGQCNKFTKLQFIVYTQN